MDIPGCPSQNPQSPEEEEEKSLSERELLNSPDEEDRFNSDSEIVQEGENGSLSEEDEETIESPGRGLELEREREEKDENAPDFVSDAEDEEPLGETEGMGQEDGTIMLLKGDDDCPQGEQLDRAKEAEEQEDKVIDTPQSPDSEPGQGKRFITEEDGEDGEEGYSVYGSKTSKKTDGAQVDEEEEEDGRMRAVERRRATALNELKDDSVSVSRELDEHELDYDEEVPEVPSIPPHEEEEDEEDAKPEGEVESEDKGGKKEKKMIPPTLPQDAEFNRTDPSKGPEKLCRDSFKDKKDEDDGEMDEGEIDVSHYSLLVVICQSI